MKPLKRVIAGSGIPVQREHGCNRFTAAPWLPPYEAECVGDFVAASEVTAEPGSLVVLQSAPCDSDHTGGASGLETVVTTLRRRLPASPVVLWLPGACTEEVVGAVQAASRAHVRAITCGDRPRGDLVRAQLTDPVGLSSFVLYWAADAGYLAAGEDHEDVRALLDAAPAIRTLNRLSRNRQVAARTWRSHLQRRALPPPAAWLGLAHALHAALVVQRHAEMPLHVLARAAGAQTVVNLSQRFRHAFALTPGAVRGILGPELLLHRWFIRQLAGCPRRAAVGHSSTALAEPHRVPAATGA